MQTIFFNKIVTENKAWCFVYDPETKRQSSEWVGETSPQQKETEIPNVPHQDHVDNFFDSQGVVHKEFVPEGNTVSAEFYRGVMDRFLKLIQWACPAAFCCQVFSCCTIMRPPTKLQVFFPFLTPKICYNHLSPPYSPDLSPLDYCLFSKLKMKLKGPNFSDVAEIQQAVTDEFKKVQK